MRTTVYLLTGATMLVSAAINPAVADGNSERGAKVYRACAVCHSLEPNLNLTGPSLADMWGKKAASVATFVRYSKALKAQAFIWEDTTLDAWLANPEAFVPENYMTFRGISDKSIRSDLVAFLRLALAPQGSTAVVTKGLINAETARGQAPEPLDVTSPAEQVTAIRHCQNTFFVVTADGKEHPFWEMNLRFKVDSSASGPKSGKPVITSSGMQGDRASIIFLDPAEISALVQSKC